MKKLIYLFAFIFSVMIAQSQVTLTFIGNEGIPLDSVSIQNLDQDCDTTLYGIAVSLYLQDATIYTNINEVKAERVINLMKVYDLSGKLIYTGKDTKQLKFPNDGYYILKIFWSDGAIQTDKVYSGVQTFEYSVTPITKSTTVSNPWIWFSGDFLEITGHATGYFDEVITDSPIDNELYVFDFEPSITGVVQGTINYLNTSIPIPMVNVSIDGESCYTDSTGFYQINVAPGYQTVYITKPGYDEFGGAIEVTNDTIVFNHEMESDYFAHKVEGNISNINGYLEGYEVTFLGSNLSPIITDEDGYFELEYVPYTNRTFVVYDIYGGDVLSDTTIYIESDTLVYWEVPYSTPCDVDSIEYGGQWYETVEINNQCWFKENLNIGNFVVIDSVPPPFDDGVVQKHCFNDDENMCDSLGAMYRWDEMMAYDSIEEAQGICPDGWHVPAQWEWEYLFDYADETGDSTGYHLKHVDFGGNDTFGMSIHGCGYTVYGLNEWGSLQYGDYWSSTETTSSEAWTDVFNKFHEFATFTVMEKSQAKGVRCIKNN